MAKVEIDDNMINYLSNLSKLNFDAEAREEIKKDLSRMLDFVEKLNELNTDGVEPLVYMTEEYNVMREDVVKQETTHDEALKNAPRKDSDYFKVPRVVEKK